MDKFDYNYTEMGISGFSWPVVKLELRLVVNYLITDEESGARLSQGHTVQVPVELDTGIMLIGTPPVLYRNLGIDP